MILFWLYHRLLFANEVKLIHSNRRRVAKKKKEKKKLNRINSDKVHECSFKNKVGRTNTFIRSPFTQSHARAGTHTMFKWVRQPVNLLKTTPVISVCLCVQSHDTHTQHNQPVREFWQWAESSRSKQGVKRSVVKSFVEKSKWSQTFYGSSFSDADLICWLW